MCGRADAKAKTGAARVLGVGADVVQAAAARSRGREGRRCDRRKRCYSGRAAEPVASEANGDNQRAGRQQPQTDPTASETGGEKPQSEAATTGARADTRAVGSAPGSAADSAPVRNLQGALEMAAEEKGAKVSSWQQQEPATSETDGEAMQPQMQEAAAALAASSAATTAPGSPSGAAHNLQGALDAAAERGTMVSSSAEAQRNWTRLGAQRQLNEPMDLEPGAQEPHAEPRRAAVAAEPHKRRALPAAEVPAPEVPEGATIVSRVLGDGLPGEEHSMRFAAGSSTGATSAARWGDGRKPCARPVTAGSRRAGRGLRSRPHPSIAWEGLLHAGVSFSSEGLREAGVIAGEAGACAGSGVKRCEAHAHHCTQQALHTHTHTSGQGIRAGLS